MMFKANNINKTYNHSSAKLHILKDIDLEISEGEALTIVGPSGAGKSTLLHILGGLDKPDVGTVEFDGKNIYKLNDVQRSKFRNQKVGFIFQFYHLLPEFSALENVLLPAYINKNGTRYSDLKSKAEKLLERVGLKSRISHKPNQMSGGEQQRVAIARSLINEPRIIFCDEPTGNLDSENGKVIIDLLLELNRTNNQTLVVTHDKDLSRRSGRIIYMKDGQLIL